MENNMDMKKVIEERLTMAEQEKTFLQARVYSMDKEIELYTTLLNLYEETENTMKIKEPVPVVVKTNDVLEDIKPVEPCMQDITFNESKQMVIPIVELTEIKDDMPKNTQNRSTYTYDIIKVLEESMRPVQASEVAARMHTKVGCIHKALIMMVHQGLITRDKNKRYSLPKKEVV